jgi:hypothetical protein
MSDAGKFVVLDRELEEEKGPRFLRLADSMPTMRLVAPKEDKWFCTCG